MNERQQLIRDMLDAIDHLTPTEYRPPDYDSEIQRFIDECGVPGSELPTFNMVRDAFSAGAAHVVSLSTQPDQGIAILQRAIAMIEAPRRERMPDTRHSITHKFTIGVPGRLYKGYITVGLFADGRPGELFICMSKAGSTTRGLMDAIGVLTSIALQSGVDLPTFVRKFEHTRFEPYGPSTSEAVGECSSVLDYIFRWLGETFPSGKLAAQQETDDGTETE